KMSYLFFLFFFLSHPASIANQIASFDPYFLLLFHPSMAKFDQSVHRFQQTDFLDALSQKEWNLQRAKLLRELRNQKKDLSSRSLQGFYSKLPQLKRDFPHEEDYISEYQKLRSQYLGLGQDSFLETEYSRFYKNDQESLKIFSKIWRDIRVVMAQLQKKKEYLFFLPLYRESQQIARKPYNLQFSGKNMGISPYLDYSYHYSSINKQEEVWIRLKDQLKHQEATRELLYPHMSSKFVLYGYEDVTELLLKAILLRNNVEQEIVSIVSDVYQMWLTKKQKEDI
ncbi:hypothetical protein MJH12_09430, partial [bacterium]|nr:hypothetical protein [bacterium]